MTDNQHLIEILYLENGKELIVNDFCKNDSEFNRKINAYYRVHNITYVVANHNSKKVGTKALTRDGKWVEVKKSNAYCKAGKQTWNGYHRDRRQYLFSSMELANFMFKLYRPYGATLQGRLMTVPFGIGIGKTYIEDTFKKVKYAF